MNRKSRAGCIKEQNFAAKRHFSASPASYAKWQERRDNKLKRVDPSFQAKVSEFKSGKSSKVLVLFHVFHVDLVEEILNLLENIPVEFDLIITNSSGSSIEDLCINSSARKVLELKIKNKGRDILPTIDAVNAGLLEPYELVFKVHTKKSEWRQGHDSLDGSGEEWRNSFLNELIGSVDSVKAILAEFAQNSSLGVLTSDGNVLGPEYWGDNEATTSQLLWRIQIHLNRDVLSFAAGSIYWARAFLLQGLSVLELCDDDFESESGQNNQTTAHAVERILGVLTAEAGYTTASVGSFQPGAAKSDLWRQFSREFQKVARARVVPFYLPQFHRIAENDEWWGKGFTEWSNVTAAVPNFYGHQQPFLPSELGFYDLSHEDVRIAQTQLASEHYVGGFMYYYYWFAGRKLLNKPIESHHEGAVEFPFCLMWANENWTRSWDGGNSHVLLGQDYDSHPAEEFLRDIIPLLKDRRYLRVGEKPVLAVYKIAQLANPSEVIANWREIAIREGVGELFILACDLGAVMDGVTGNPETLGMDGVLEFPPHNNFWGVGELESQDVCHHFDGRIMSYAQTATRAEEKLFRQKIEKWRYPGVMVNFDNTARRQESADIWIGSNPYTFHRWLRSAILAVADRPADERLIFVNAWNEWAEGAVLEPSVRWGNSYLLATKAALLV